MGGADVRPRARVTRAVGCALLIACLGLAVVWTGAEGAERWLLGRTLSRPDAAGGTAPAGRGTSLRRLAADAGLPLPLPDPSVRVRKSGHLLELRNGAEVLKTYPIALGQMDDGSPTAALGPKRSEGDRRTPEGRYRVCDRHKRGPFHLWLALDYPNADDADRGFADGVISAKQRDAIRTTLTKGRVPPSDTPLGGEIGIHGSGTASDWTHGCIALEDRDIDELWDAVGVGTPVEIVP